MKFNNFFIIKFVILFWVFDESISKKNQMNSFNGKNFLKIMINYYLIYNYKIKYFNFKNTNFHRKI